MFRWEYKLHAVRISTQTQLTHLPFGSGVSASFHQLHITELTAIHVVNPSDPLLDPCPDLGFTTWTVRALLTRVSLLTAHAGRVNDSSYVETGNGASLGGLFLPFMRPPFTSRVDIMFHSGFSKCQPASTHPSFAYGYLYCGPLTSISKQACRLKYGMKNEGCMVASNMFRCR